MSAKISVVTASDRCSADPSLDTAGPGLKSWLESRGHLVAGPFVVPDDLQKIEELLIERCGSGDDLVLTCGGTGLAPRDVTPEATMRVIERVVPGIPEAMRTITMAATPKACLSRGVAGTRGKTLIVNLPGSKRGSLECLEAVSEALFHAVEMMSGESHDCAGHYGSSKNG